MNKPCQKNGDGCSCIHMREVSSFNKTVRFVLSSVGNEVPGNAFTYPMHLHGHHFHMSEIGYGSYSPNNGKFKSRNSDIVCDDAPCTNSTWNTSRQIFSMNEKTVLKDT